MPHLPLEVRKVYFYLINFSHGFLIDNPTNED